MKETKLVRRLILTVSAFQSTTAADTVWEYMYVLIELTGTLSNIRNMTNEQLPIAGLQMCTDKCC